MVLHAHPLTLHAARPYQVLLHVIDEFHDARFAGAVRTTKKSPVALDAVPDNAASAMFTRRRHALDRALKRVEHVHRAVGVHLERRRVIVTADFTYGHERAPPTSPAPTGGHQHSSQTAAPVSIQRHVVCDGEPPIQTHQSHPCEESQQRHTSAGQGGRFSDLHPQEPFVMISVSWRHGRRLCGGHHLEPPGDHRHHSPHRADQMAAADARPASSHLLLRPARPALTSRGSHVRRPAEQHGQWADKARRDPLGTERGVPRDGGHVRTRLNPAE
jgi:hypothetical protein